MGDMWLSICRILFAAALVGESDRSAIWTQLHALITFERHRCSGSFADTTCRQSRAERCVRLMVAVAVAVALVLMVSPL